MEYMICARFHAMILSTTAKQKIHVMTYSKKIDRVIDDLELNLPVLHLNELDENYELKLESFKSVEDKKVQTITNNAKLQDEAIRKYIL